MVLELMQEMNLSSIRTNSKETYKRINKKKKKDVLQLNFSANAPNQMWVSDTTCFRLKNQFYYICVIVDIYSRKVIAYKISQKHSSHLISGTFKEAYKERTPGEGLIFHSDRGCQFTAYSFRKLLDTCKVEQSFSPTAKPCHNAVMESFFSSMKREELYRVDYHSAAEFKKRIASYIDFYNTVRPHTTLNYKTPNTYEQQYLERQVQKKS